MQDRELVAAIAAGDADGLAEAYDRYAAALYTYCRFMLPDPDPMGGAAEAVQDTFIVAAAKLAELTDPDRLRSWLHAVARNECLRRLGPRYPDAGGPVSPSAVSPSAVSPSAVSPSAGSLAPDGALPEVTLPGKLRDKVLAACADSSPTGRAYRASVTYRAGSFGRTGFPRPAVPSGPRWRHILRTRPRAAAVAAVAGAVVLGGVVAVAMLGGAHHTPTSPVALGGGVPALGASSAPPGGPSSPVHRPAAKTAAATSPPSADGLTSGQPTPSGQATAARTASPSPSPSPSPSSSPSSSPPPAPGWLKVSPTSLTLTAPAGKVARGTIILTAVDGPVTDWSIKVPAAVAGKVTLSQYSGSLASGARVAIIVSVQSKVAVDTTLTVNPGLLHVTVVLKISA